MEMSKMRIKHQAATKRPRRKMFRVPAQLAPSEAVAGGSSSDWRQKSGTTHLVRDLKEGSLFEVCGVRYRKVHSNDCRAYVRLEGKRHVVLNDGTEFDAKGRGYHNISPNTVVTFIDEEVENLI
jgi:hypothetical protein